MPCAPARAPGSSNALGMHAKGRKSVQMASEKRSKKQVMYGKDWYAQTNPSERRTVKEELRIRKEANLRANNGKERKDLYTDNWDGSEYKGNPVNVLSVLAVVSVLTPLAGLLFAYLTYGKLWG